MDKPAAKLGRAIRKARKKNKLTQKRVSELAGVNLSHYKNIEVGRTIPSLSKLDSIIEALSMERSHFYPHYLPLLNTIDSCLDFMMRCRRYGLERLAYKSAKKLYQLSSERKISRPKIDLIIIFFDKYREK